MPIAYVGIGSNVGNREKNCFHAIELLEGKGIKVRKKSSLCETEPWGYKNQPAFLNMAVEIETKLGPEELLKLLKEIEAEIGRKKSFRWGPRVIDLDILLFDNIILSEEDLKIPHPHMHERDFVLIALNEIAPGINHPVLNVSIDDLLHRSVGK
ncbi:MAG: 2-amino-4-hydroxy-6-hydroxymethyldihydropteridine diphosphokinase [Nitrospirota bacterium]